MILYDNRDIRQVLLRKSGSVVWTRNVLGTASLSSILCLVLLLHPELKEACQVSITMGRIYATIIGFCVVLRTGMAFNRYFDSVAEVQLMFSKWRDAFATLMSFFEASIEEYQRHGNVEMVEVLIASKAKLLHWFSLLTAFAVQRLQSQEEEEDFDFEDDGAERDASTLLPPMDIRSQLMNRFQTESTHSFRPTSVRVSLLQRQGHSVMMPEKPQSFVQKRVSTAVVAGSDTGASSYVAACFEPPTQADAAGADRATNATSSSADEAAAEEAAAAGLSTFSLRPEAIAARRSDREYDSMGLPIASGRSPKVTQHRFQPGNRSAASTRGVSLTASTVASESHVKVLGKITAHEKRQIVNSSDPMFTVLKWILLEISLLSIQKHLLIAGPILARIYQELSNGMLGFFSALKIADVPFPFPFAQVLQWAMFYFFALCPFLVLNDVPTGYMGLSTSWASVLLNFLACMSFACLNEVAIELEDPFGDDDNDYPVHVQQWSLVYALEDCFFQSVRFAGFPTISRSSTLARAGEISSREPSSWSEQQLRFQQGQRCRSRNKVRRHPPKTMSSRH
eukprot:gnl/TRDRNA2_/TRDRNA2_157326_c0_seq2.p1 gnl/TRDRNA2_/TRDRNA2_157326_c0~~gnl/TRDRNA2_/TRDRNA2_157326_c0_seq2.p1  ORF type:complete len:592 (-),score=92.78 gnl/TRDRNA2_/TRDRNA2_157326_c0_seq2:511-2211(-)